MSNQFSYTSLRCILEYLEANKRVHIASRSPLIHRAEKSIPFHLDSLLLQETYIGINKIGYGVSEATVAYDESKFPERPSNEILTDGDVRIGPDITVFIKWEAQTNGEVRLSRRLSEKTPMHLASKKLMCFFLGSRQEIYVRRLYFNICGRGTLRLPANFKVHSKRLYVKYDDFRNFLCILKESCFPLKELATGRLEQGFLNHKLLKSAQKLIIDTGFERAYPVWFIPELAQFRHKNMDFECFPRDKELILMRIVQSWLEHGCEEDTVFRMRAVSKGSSILYLNSIKNHFEMQTMEILVEGQVPTIHCLFKPINSTFGVFIYRMARYEDADNVDIVMRVMDTKKVVFVEKRGLWEKFQDWTGFRLYTQWS